MGLFAALLSGIPGCASSDTVLRRNTGDNLTARLKLGMTNSDVDLAIADLRKWIESDGAGSVTSEKQLYFLYEQDYYPKDVLKTVDVGTPCRVFTYWTNPAGGKTGALKLFFDENTQRLRGWVNYPSAYSINKFMHEKITSQLKWSEGGLYKGMSHDQVHALIGKPEEIIAAPKESREIHEDHFWVIKPNLDPIKQKIEVYSYSISNGERRRVYLLYYPAADRLNSWGYDHAWEEAARYLREQGAKQK